MVTWPASVAPLAKTAWLPTLQSWAMWEYAMKRLLLPIRVTPPPCVVPRLTVENSRKRFASPTTSSVRSPLNFRSCGSPPTEQNESKMFLRPIAAQLNFVSDNGERADPRAAPDTRG